DGECVYERERESCNSVSRKNTLCSGKGGEVSLSLFRSDTHKHTHTHTNTHTHTHKHTHTHTHTHKHTHTHRHDTPSPHSHPLPALKPICSQLLWSSVAPDRVGE